MPSLKLPELSASVTPDFIDVAGCKTWLENLPLANVAAAQTAMLSELDEFNRLPTRPLTRLEVMEAMREAVNFVQIEQARRFTNRAQPMSESEAAVFTATLALWDAMHLGYLRCVEAALGGEAALRGQEALVCQRALAFTGLKMFHHYRAYRQVSGRDWRMLHEVYRAAETIGVAEDKVKDYLNRDVHDTSPRIAYVRAILVGLCNPNELAQRQLTFVAYLLERWGEKIEVRREPPAATELAPLVVDLAGESSADRESSGAATDARYLDTDRLAKSMRNRIGLLRRGESPARLALGEDCVQPSCEQLLVFLYRQWCQARVPRAGERKHSAMATAQICNRMEVIHYYLSGRVFRQPGEQKELTQKERQEIATFGRISTRDEDDYSQVHGFRLEQWNIEDESLQGMQLLRPASTPGGRFSHGQLIAVRAAGAPSFMLGQVRWLMTGERGNLHAGLRMLPGVAAATAVRPTGLNAMDEKFVQAVSLTAVPALKVPPMLVLPIGMYKPKRIIEVFVTTGVRVRLLEIAERGTDFERVAYEAVD